jgi:glutathione peroxidase-family protein
VCAPLLCLCVQDIDGKDTSLSKFQGKVCLVVNLASEFLSKCVWLAPPHRSAC